MTLTLSYQHHSQICVMMTERTSEEDKGSLVIIFTDGRITMSSKVMQMFSPLFRGLVTDTSGVGGSDKKDPMTLILPDYNSKIMIHLMNVLKYGELVVGAEEIEEVKTTVSTLAETLGIRLNLDNISEVSCHGKNRVKKLEDDMLQTSIKPEFGTYQDIEGEYFEESLKEEMKEEVSAGHGANLNSNRQLSDAGKPRTRDLPQDDSSSCSPMRSPKDMNYDEDLSSEDEARMKDEAFKEDKSEHEESEDESEDDAKESDIDADENEDLEFDQTDAGSPGQPEHPGARVEDSPQDDEGGHFRVLRRRRKSVIGPGIHSTTPTSSQSCLTVRPKRRSWIEKYTYDEVTKKYSCRICQKEFRTPAGAYLHINSAHEDVRYPCPSCGKTYSQSGSLKLHIKVAHEGFRYPCKICGKKYTHKHRLQCHNKSVHRR